MTNKFWLTLLLFMAAADAGTLSVVSVTAPNGTSAASGQHSGFADASPLNWTEFGATANGGDGTIVMTGVLECVPVSGCAGGTPAQFRVDFTGSNFSTADINFQGTLFGTVPNPDVYGVLYGTVNTVIFTGIPTIVGNQVQESPANQIMSLTIPFAFDEPTFAKALLAQHEPVDGIPPGAFYGWTVLTVEDLTGRLDFRDPLTNSFTNSTDVPEAGTIGLLGLGLAILAASRVLREPGR
ncbi:MAG: hypothetical protein JNK87_32030 [Bryobacterales bacterium]|nr:hypothetical protein [Bryobacterales bacterium]